MTSRSIFQKICPGCMITQPVDARECACGHQFDHDDTDAALSSEEIRVKAEELYESYLAARSEQAANRVMSAQAEFARDPADNLKSRRVADAIEEAEQARAALAEQAARVRELRKALPPAPAPARPQPAPVAQNKILARVKPSPAPARPRVAAKPVLAVVSAPAASPPRPEPSAPKSIPALEKSPPQALVMARPEEVLPPAQSRTPNTAFRQAQAARAEKILRAANQAESPAAGMKNKSAPAQKKKPEMEPAAPLPKRSAPRLLAADKKECPNCTSRVEHHSNRCRCGYEFPTSEQLIPGLSMSEEDRAEFAKLFSFP